LKRNGRGREGRFREGELVEGERLMGRERAEMFFPVFSSKKKVSFSSLHFSSSLC
jgi:hypothetical protein